MREYTPLLSHSEVVGRLCFAVGIVVNYRPTMFDLPKAIRVDSRGLYFGGALIPVIPKNWESGAIGETVETAAEVTNVLATSINTG
jgi:hypothetical protein